MKPNHVIKRVALAFGLAWWLSLCINGQILDGAKEIVDLHNRFRSLVSRERKVSNMKKMYWDPQLAYEAAQWAVCENIGRTWMDYDYDELGIPTRGLNAAVSRRNDTIVRMMRRWFQQRVNYEEEYNICVFGKPCKKFMQLASADTDKLGCALKPDCKVGNLPIKFLVCMYSPGLNQANPIYKTGPVCSKCKAPASFCDKGLCVPCDQQPRDRQCACGKTCGKPGVGYGILDKRTCQCSCVYGAGPNCDEECRNPEQYLEYDICADLGEGDCEDPDPEIRAMLHEFCPERCSCKPLPSKLTLDRI